MKYLLCAINAKFIHSNPAVYGLKAYAKAKEIGDAELVIREYTINQYVDDILADLYEEGMDVLVLSCYLWNEQQVMEIAAEYKKIDPHVTIWVGGPEVSYDGPQVLKKNPSIDLVMQGEGEETFTRLVQAFQSMPGQELLDSYKKIPGIAYRLGDEYINQGLTRMEDLDRLPFPYDDFEPFTHRIIYYESSRGCPFSCSYCLSSVGERVRFRSLPLVYEELSAFLAARIPQVKFVDRTFNCNRERAMAIWTYLRDHDNGFTNFHFEIAGDLLTDEAVELFGTMRPGLIQLEIGLQSTYDATLLEITRKSDLDLLFKNFHGVRQTGNVHQHLDLIAGLPYEDYERFKESFSRAVIFLPDQLQLGFLKVLKGTRMRENAKEYGLVYRDHAPYEVIRTKWMSYGDLIRLKRINEILETWYNSGGYYYTMKYVIPFYETPFTFFEAFADWSHDKGYDRVRHNRQAKFEIFYEFLMTNEEIAYDREALEDIMVYDWYRKERSKTRPVFARDSRKYKEVFKNLYRKAGDRLFPDLEDSGKVYDSRKAAATSHIEHFKIDMEAFLLYGEISHRDSFMLFDYEQAHPLTHAARNMQWESCEEVIEGGNVRSVRA